MRAGGRALLSRDPETPVLRLSQPAGFVLALILVVVALGLGIAGAALTVALAGSATSRADTRLTRAQEAAQAAILEARELLAWGGLCGLFEADDAVEWSCGSPVADEVDVALSVRRETGPDGGPLFGCQAVARARWGTGRSAVQVRLAPDRLPAGVTVAGDADVGADLELDGTGLYVGGDVRGREWVEFAPGPDGSRCADRARPVQWEYVGVHAAGHIYDAGIEVHAAGKADPYDTDAVTGGSACATAVSDGALSSLCAHAWLDCPPGGSPLDLEDLATRAAVAGPAPSPLSGRVVVVRPAAGGADIVGLWPRGDASQQLTLVVLGDAQMGSAGAAAPDAGTQAPTTVLCGALVVTGTLTVQGPSVVQGSVSAGTLRVDGPLGVTVSPDWCAEPPPGFLTTHVVGVVSPAPCRAVSCLRRRETGCHERTQRGKDFSHVRVPVLCGRRQVDSRFAYRCTGRSSTEVSPRRIGGSWSL